MKRILIISISAALLLGGWVAAVQVRALPATAIAAGVGVPPVQYWRTGFTVKPLPVYAGVTGRAVSAAAEVQSARDTDVFFVFPAVSSRRAVHGASFYILNRTGDYAGTIAMTLETYNYAGNLQHVVSAGSVDLQAATPLVWTRLALSDTGADRLVEPGEFLAFHFASSGAPAGSLDVRPVFEVAVGPLQIYLPLIRGGLSSYTSYSKYLNSQEVKQ
jgi:hypothetical protein